MRKRKFVWIAGTLVTFLLGGTIGLVGASDSDTGTGNVAPAVVSPLRVGWGRMVAGYQTLAEVLGMKPEDLREARRSGKTVAELAQEKGMSLEKLREEFVARRQATLKELVRGGKLTQAQADACLARMKAQAGQRWENAGPAGSGRGRQNALGAGRGPGSGRGRGGRGGFGGRGYAGNCPWR